MFNPVHFTVINQQPEGIKMDIKTLEELGVKTEDLTNRIVDEAVQTLLYSTGFNPETEEEVTYENKFKREIESKIQQTVDQKIAAIAAEHILPRVGELIESANMVQTNKWGEAKSAPMSFKEYIAHRADAYMCEEVDINGKSKGEGDSYNWRSCGPRLSVLMRSYIKDSMEAAAKSAVNDINKVIARNIEKASKDAIAATVENLKVSISA